MLPCLLHVSTLGDLGCKHEVEDMPHEWCQSVTMYEKVDLILERIFACDSLHRCAPLSRSNAIVIIMYSQPALFGTSSSFI